METLFWLDEDMPGVLSFTLSSPIDKNQIAANATTALVIQTNAKSFPFSAQSAMLWFENDLLNYLFKSFAAMQEAYQTLITSSDGSQSLAAAGVNTFLEIMFDGSVRGRIILANDSNRVNVNLFPIANALTTFEEIYSTLICNNIERIFVSAHKYQRLTVLRQFVPYYDTSNIGADDYGYKTYLQDHKRMYGGNLIVTSGRIPYCDYSLIDRRTFNQSEVKYNKENLLQILFSNAYFNIGYIDPPNGIDRLLVTEF